VGEVLSGLTIDLLRQSPALVDRGIRHVEELQLFSVGIGPDRISDAVANVLKRFLVDYTQKQAELWEIPVGEAIPLNHVWDASSGTWVDEYASIPADPATGVGILLVPRWIVRARSQADVPSALRLRR
jgi:hypothetical protein